MSTMSMSTMSMFTMPHHVHLVQHCSPGEAAGKEDKEQGARLEEGLEAGHHPGEEPSNEIAKAKTKSTSSNIMSPNQIGHNDVCNHTCAHTFLRDLGVDKWTDVSAEVGDTITSGGGGGCQCSQYSRMRPMTN